MNDFKKQRKQKRFDDIKHTLRQAESIIEVVALSLIYYFVWKTMYDESGFYAYLGKGKYLLMTVYAIISFIIFNNCDSFKFGHMRLTDVLISQWISVILVNVITYFQLCLMANYMIKPYPMFILTLLEAMAVLIFSLLYSFIYHRLYVPKSMAMVYGMEDAITLKFKMDTRADKYQIKKLISIDEGYEKICDTIVKYDAVVINDVSAVIRNDILKFCYKNGIRVYVTPKLTDIILRGAGDINLFDTPLLLVKGNGLTLAQRAVKRFFDVLLSLIAMIIASPIMLIVSLAIKLEDGGPVFYRQTRVTKNGKEFDILKFRSMVVDAEKNGEVIPAKGRDPRITKTGRIIRATRIDYKHY